MTMDNTSEIMGEESERALLVGFNDDRGEIDIEYSMNELKELARAAGAEVVEIIIQNKKTIDATFYIGKGKVEEVGFACESLGANVVIFNDELSGAQLRNLEAALGLKVIDRTTLILDIFARRAQSKVSKLQVEMAQLKYSMPRLKGLGSSMSRTGGGIGTRGPGEQKLEIDRRRIRERIFDIGKELEEAIKVRETQRSLRVKNQVPVVSIVGYTNAGKSSLMNRLIEITDPENTEKQVFVKDMLFATLDTFSRRIKMDDNKEFILVDTVGFVSKLPHSLVQAFKATLEEVVEADLLVHVVDCTNSNFKNQIDITERVLAEIGAKDKLCIYAFNKVDLLSEEERINFAYHDSVRISALTGEGMVALVDEIKNAIFTGHKRVQLILPYEKGAIVSDLMERCTVYKSEYLAEGTWMDVDLEEKDLSRYIMYLATPESNPSNQTE